MAALSAAMAISSGCFVKMHAFSAWRPASAEHNFLCAMSVLGAWGADGGRPRLQRPMPRTCHVSAVWASGARVVSGAGGLGPHARAFPTKSTARSARFARLPTRGVVFQLSRSASWRYGHMRHTRLTHEH